MTPIGKPVNALPLGDKKKRNSGESSAAGKTNGKPSVWLVKKRGAPKPVRFNKKTKCWWGACEARGGKEKNKKRFQKTVGKKKQGSFQKRGERHKK